MISPQFTPDGNRAVVGFQDGRLELWRVDSTLDELLTWTRNSRYVLELTCDSGNSTGWSCFVNPSNQRRPYHQTSHVFEAKVRDCACSAHKVSPYLHHSCTRYRRGDSAAGRPLPGTAPLGVRVTIKTGLRSSEGGSGHDLTAAMSVSSEAWFAPRRDSPALGCGLAPGNIDTPAMSLQGQFRSG